MKWNSFQHLTKNCFFLNKIDLTKDLKNEFKLNHFRIKFSNDKSHAITTRIKTICPDAYFFSENIKNSVIMNVLLELGWWYMIEEFEIVEICRPKISNIDDPDHRLCMIYRKKRN
jgi:hypothetical protein